MRKPKQTDEVSQGPHFASGLILGLAGYGSLNPSEQTRLLSGINDALKATDEFQKASREKRLILTPLDGGFCLVFRDAPLAALHCADQIMIALSELDHKVKGGIELGIYDEVEDVEGRRIATGGLVKDLRTFWEEAKPGQILLSPQVLELAKELPSFKARIRKTSHEESDSTERYHLITHRDFDETEVQTRWKALAKKLRDRASQRKSPADLASEHEVAERLATLYRDAKAACFLVVFALLLHFWSEETDAGHRLQLWAYQQLSGSVTGPSGDLPVTVVDFGAALQGANSSGSTDMAALANLIAGVAKYKPAAIGVDVDFGPLPDQTFAPDEEKVVALADQLTHAQTPVYLTVHRCIWLTPDTWLGDIKYAGLVAHPLVPIETLTGQITLFDQLSVPHGPGQQASVPSMPGALAVQLDRFTKRKLLPRSLASPYAVSDVVYQSENARLPSSIGERYYLNLAALPKLQSDAIHASTPNELEAYPDVDRRLRNAAVLIGSSAPDSEGSVPDQWIVPGTGESKAGVYLLAIGTYTKAVAPLYELSKGVRNWLTLVVSLAVVIGVMLLRFAFITSARPIGESKLSVFVTVTLAVLTVAAGITMVRMFGILWTDYFLVAILLMIHPRIEHYLTHGWSFAKKNVKQLWRKFLFADK